MRNKENKEDLPIPPSLMAFAFILEFGFAASAKAVLEKGSVDYVFKPYYLKIEAYLKNMGFSLADFDEEVQEIPFLESQDNYVNMERNRITVRWMRFDKDDNLYIDDFITLRRDGKVKMQRTLYEPPEKGDVTVAGAIGQTEACNWSGNVENFKLLFDSVHDFTKALFFARNDYKLTAYAALKYPPEKKHLKTYNLLPDRPAGFTDLEFATFVADAFLDGRDEWTDRLYQVLKRAYEIKKLTMDSRNLNPNDQNYLFEIQSNMENKFPEGQEIVWAAFELIHERAMKRQDITTIDDL